MRLFVDTNVFVYLFDASAPRKQEIARELIRREGPRGSLVLSTQVLQELYVTVTTKLEVPLPADEALAATRDLADWSVVQVDPPLVFAAIDLSVTRQLSFWDALVVRAAIQSKSARLSSEDLQDGMEIDGVRIENPFAGTVLTPFRRRSWGWSEVSGVDRPS